MTASKQGRESLELRLRTEAEQDAYMEGQRAALALAREHSLEYAEEIIGLSQKGILELRRDG